MTAGYHSHCLMLFWPSFTTCYVTSLFMLHLKKEDSLGYVGVNILGMGLGRGGFVRAKLNVL